MNETVPTSARALGSIRHPALGPKKRPTTHKSVTRGVQSALEGHTSSLNMESTGETRKRLNVTDVTYDPFSKSSSANSVSTKHRNGELRWSHRNNLSTSYDKTSLNPSINVITGLQFRAINGNRNSCNEDASETQRSSDRKKTVPDVAEQGHMERGRSFVKLNRQTLKHWPPKHNYLEDGDYVKGKGHRIDTGPMSRPVSGWLNRESRNAVELAERDKGEGVLGRYYSLDVDTGAVTARQLTNNESILIGVNGKERKKQMNGRGAEEEEEDGEEAEERTAEAEDSEAVNGESEETRSPFVPLCWNDQFMKPKVKVVKPRLPSAQPSSASVNETKPVVFWTSGLQRDVPPPSVTILQTPTKENYVSMALQKKSGQIAKKKQQSVKFDEFLHRSIRGTIDSTFSDGEENLESFRHKSLDSGGTWSASFFPIPGSRDPGKTNLQLVNGRHGETHVDMIVVGSSQISSKTSENEKPVIRGGGGGGAAVEKHPSIHHGRRGSGPGSRESGDATPREVSIINIVQPIRMKGESDESSDTTEAKKTSERKNDSAVRLRYSVRNPRASTGLRRGPPEGLCKKSPVMVRSASVREGRLAAISRENSSYDWNLNCINIKPALYGEAPKDHAQSNKTGEWSNEDARRNGSQTGGREREAVGNSDLSQPFDVVQLSPIRVKTASLQTRSTHLLENPYTETNNSALGDQSEISFAPPPSRAATPNTKRSSARIVSSVHEGEPSSRRGAVTHYVPSAAKSQVSECEDLERSPEIEEETLRRELFDGEDAERSSDALEQRQTSELQFESEDGDMESVSAAQEEQIERQSPIV